MLFPSIILELGIVGSPISTYSSEPPESSEEEEAGQVQSSEEEVR